VDRVPATGSRRALTVVVPRWAAPPDLATRVDRALLPAAAAAIMVIVDVDVVSGAAGLGILTS
jgi:hypothetical protein